MAAWSRRGFITAGDGQIKHENTVRDLVAAARLPLLTAVVKIKAHLRATTAEQLGNHWADLTAKATAGAVLPPTHAAPATEVRDVNILDVQNCAQPREVEDWLAKGAARDPDGVWRLGDRVVAPCGHQNDLDATTARARPRGL
ncbi:hypothetical protein chiPu_0027634 [Chiloscyllium punctatum]|uniref:RNase H type-1 domain-containing protein n=1 Tax=Chiloscyllium punctatum TaxID=137246 RepID=A0A401TL70_CHIPU|nr:hypothetical protein [Chiloscyllium punctatum]